MFTTDTISAVDWALTVKTSVSVWHRLWNRRPAEIKGRVTSFAWGEEGEKGGAEREGVEDRGVGRGRGGESEGGKERDRGGGGGGGGRGTRREGVWQHGADGLHKTMFAAFSFPPPAIRAVFN